MAFIEIVLGFGQRDMPLDPVDRKRPTTPEDLQARLEAQIPEDKCHQILVHVMDVSLRPGSGSRPSPGQRYLMHTDAIELLDMKRPDVNY